MNCPTDMNCAYRHVIVSHFMAYTNVMSSIISSKIIIYKQKSLFRMEKALFFVPIANTLLNYPSDSTVTTPPSVSCL